MWDAGRLGGGCYFPRWRFDRQLELMEQVAFFIAFSAVKNTKINEKIFQVQFKRKPLTEEDGGLRG